MARLANIPGVNSQERTRDDLLKTLRATLSEALEMNRTDARDAAGKGDEELGIAVSSVAIDCDAVPLTAAHRLDQLPKAFSIVAFSFFDSIGLVM